jgi:beta-lactamase class A
MVVKSNSRLLRALVAATTATTLALAGTYAIAASASADSSAATTTGVLCKSAKHPVLAARMTQRLDTSLAGRQSRVGLAAYDARLGLTCTLHAGWHFISASTIKATIISALLWKKGGPDNLTSTERSLAWNMITLSDNDAATALWNDVGMTAMQQFLNKAGMTSTQLATAWGLTQETAHDELTLLKLLTNPQTVLTWASRQYVLYLMAHVVSYERWGVSAGAPSDVTVHIKNGWLPYPYSSNWHINSIGAFTGVNIKYQIAVLTGHNPTESYGIQTIQGAAYVINTGIAGTQSSATMPSISQATLSAPGG